MIKYNDSHIFVGYIKQLLHAFNLPKCLINLTEEVKNRYSSTNSFLFIKDDSYYSAKMQNLLSNQFDIKKVDSYKMNDAISNVTKNLEIRNNIYDSYTHEYLGDYLRFIRDYTNVDLMSMYNCFSNVSVKNFKFSFTVDNEIKSYDSESSEYTIFAVPVKYGRKYTIAIDWQGNIEMFAGMYENDSEVVSDVIDNKTLANLTYMKYSGMRFNHPVLYTKLDYSEMTNKIDYAKESTLKLFLKIPNSCKSSIVILEGDYIKDTEIIHTKESQKLGNNLFLHKPDYLTFTRHIKIAKPALSSITFTRDSRFDNLVSNLYKNRYGYKYAWSNINLISPGTYDIIFTEKENVSMGDFVDYVKIQISLLFKISIVENTFNTYYSTITSMTSTNQSLSTSDKIIGYDYLSKLQLLFVNTGKKYLLADRLVEYLCSNVISPNDEIVENIKRLQKKIVRDKSSLLSNDTIPFTFKYYGIWDDSIRQFLYRYSRDKHLTDKYFDITGYLDKDLEFSINLDEIINKDILENDNVWILNM